MYVLGIESSCDECSASVVERSNPYVKALSNVVFSQVEIHRRFGGVVPEVASRNHLEMIAPVITEALKNAGVRYDDLAAIAVTQRPGLIGALLVGLSAAKAIAYARNLPLVPVNHLEGHLHSIFINDQAHIERLKSNDLPMLVCLVSGGHTNLYLVKNLPPLALDAQLLSQSRDDAAGEAFDKTAKLLGLPYPGGVHIDRLSKDGNPSAYDFPRPLPGRSNMEFSFSGLKTAVATTLANEGFQPEVRGRPNLAMLPQGQKLADYCASIQEAIAQTLVRKIRIGLEQTGARSVAVVGGVSANSRFRGLVHEKIKVPTYFPDLKYCTDNATMIAAAGTFALERGEAVTGHELLSMNAFSS